MSVTKIVLFLDKNVVYLIQTAAAPGLGDHVGKLQSHTARAAVAKDEHGRQ